MQTGQYMHCVVRHAHCCTYTNSTVTATMILNLLIRYIIFLEWLLLLTTSTVVCHFHLDETRQHKCCPCKPGSMHCVVRHAHCCTYTNSTVTATMILNLLICYIIFLEWLLLLTASTVVCHFHLDETRQQNVAHANRAVCIVWSAMRIVVRSLTASMALRRRRNVFMDICWMQQRPQHFMTEVRVPRSLPTPEWTD
jgi:hypothetical protein